FPALRPDRFLLNTAYLGTVMLGVSALASSFWLHRDRKKLAEYETAFPLVLALWGTAWWLCGGIYQIEHFWSAALLGGALVFVAATAAGLGWIGHRRDWADGLGIAWWLPAVTAFLGLMYIASLTHPFAQYGAIGWVALF